MSYLKEMIKKYCPNGVIYKKVGEVCHITDYVSAGSFATIAENVNYVYKENGYAQLIRTVDLKGQFSKPDNFVYVDEHGFNYLWRVNLNSEGLILPNVGNCGEVYYVTPIIFPNENNVLGPNAIWVKSETIKMRFLYYLFLSNAFQRKLLKIITRAGQPKFNKTNFKALTIPIPSIEIQEEIIRILDRFTTLIGLLVTELKLRKKQYEYYRTELLNDKKNKWCELSEIATYSTTKIDATNLNEKTYVGVDNLLKNKCGKTVSIHVPKSGRVIAYKAENILIGNIRPYLRKIWFADNEGGTNGDVLVIQVTSKLVQPRYLYHVLCSEQFFEYATKNSKGAKMPRGDKKAIMHFQMPLPSIEEQKHIVAILDRFDVLCNDLTQGIPSEIEARKKQYTYYRDELIVNVLEA